MNDLTWTKNDFDKGWCRIDQIGKSIGDPEKPTEQPKTGFSGLPGENAGGIDSTPATPFVALTKAERRRLTQELADKLLILAHENPAAFLDGAGPQVNKFLDAASKLDEAPPDDLPMTRERLAAMSTDDLKEYVVKKANEQGPQPAAPPAAAVANALLPLIPAERQGEAMALLKAL